MVKRIICAIVIVIMGFSTFALTGCVANIDGKHKGLSVGFNYTELRYSPIMSAMRSDKHVFDIDDVTLDFYCGWFGELPPSGNNGNSAATTMPIVCIAFYVYEKGTMWTLDLRDDYRAVSPPFFITEVPVEEYVTEGFFASQTKTKGKIFNRSGERITIPQEAFSRAAGRIGLFAAIVSFSYEDNLYHLRAGNFWDPGVIIDYDFTNESTVRLRRAGDRKYYTT